MQTERQARDTSQELTVLLVEDSPEYAVLIQRWLQGKPDDSSRFTLNWTDTLESALRRLAAGGVDVILLDLGLPDSDGLATFTAVRDHCGSTPVIVLSGADSETLALRLIQDGAADYLVKTSCTEHLLRRALRYAVVRQQNSRPAESEQKRTKIIGVAGCKGGTGATTLACVLAAELRVVTEARVLLADLDLIGGSVSFVAGITPRHSLQDALLRADSLDQEMWNTIVTKRAGDLDILASPPAAWNSDLDPSSIRRLFHDIFRYYDWMVLDFGRVGQQLQCMADLPTEFILVTTQSLASLHQCKQAVKFVGDRGLLPDRLRLAVNRREPSSAISDKELQNVFGVPVICTLPEAPDDLHNALLQNRLPSASGAYRQEVNRLAREFAGLPSDKPKTLRYQLSSIADRLRRRPNEPEAASL